MADYADPEAVRRALDGATTVLMVSASESPDRVDRHHAFVDAGVLSGTAGRAVRYQPETVAEAYASRASYGAPQWQVDARVSTYTAVAAGAMATVTPDVEELTGHPATSLADLMVRR